MDPKENDKYQAAQVQIRQLFERCAVPNKGSNKRISNILIRGLHELSLRDLVQFSAKLAATMLQVMSGPNQQKTRDGEQK